MAVGHGALQPTLLNPLLCTGSVYEDLDLVSLEKAIHFKHIETYINVIIHFIIIITDFMTIFRDSSRVACTPNDGEFDISSQ